MNRDYETMAAVVHGFTAFGHLLGLVHAIRQRSRFDGTVHGLALGYDLWAVYKHAKAARG